MTNKKSKEKIVRGFKFLNPNGATIYEGEEYPYILPQPGEKWGAWFKHPSPSKPDGQPCGYGGWHISKRLNDKWGICRYPWFAEGRIILGEDRDKIRVVEIRLRRIPRKLFEKLLRIGWGKNSNLRNADLSDTNLRNANLSSADLSDANLRNADLSDTNLRNADLSDTNLRNANLSSADLSDANLRNANLRNANLSDTNLSSADLSDADLRNADLRNADLSSTYNLIGAILKNARYNQYTKWPKGFDPKLKKYGMIKEEI